MTWIAVLKILAAILVGIGVVLAFLDIKYRPHGLLLESSPTRPTWLSAWLCWAVTSLAAILYIVLDWIE
jgi:hypothetical protein